MFLSELVGTFLFVFSILCITSIAGLNAIETAVSVGLALIVSILVTLGLNKDAKAHLNPAVSFSFFSKGNIKVGTLSILVIMQIIAGLLALGAFKLIKAADAALEWNK